MSYSATKCVALDSSVSCTGYTTSGRADWEMTCNNTPVAGVGVCSSTAGSLVGQTADTLAVSNTTESNIYCWCKMTSPAVSKFVYASRNASLSACVGSCGGRCGSGAAREINIRRALFSNLK